MATKKCSIGSCELFNGPPLIRQSDAEDTGQLLLKQYRDTNKLLSDSEFKLADAEERVKEAREWVRMSKGFEREADSRYRTLVEGVRFIANDIQEGLKAGGGHHSLEDVIDSIHTLIDRGATK